MNPLILGVVQLIFIVGRMLRLLDDEILKRRATQLTVQFSRDTSGPWRASDGQGGEYDLVTHDIYTPGSTDPV